VRSRGIDTVFLDFGGVFCVPAHEAVLGALAPAAVVVDPALLDRAHYAGMAALDAGEGEDQAWTDYMTAYTTAAGVPEELRGAAMEALFTARLPWSRVLPGSVEALQELAKAGVKLAIVSNSEGTLEGRLRALGVCQVGAGPAAGVAAVIDSTVVGVSKPDPGIFELALRATGSTPAGALHVGDSVRYDVAGARAAGVLPLHFDPFGFCGDTSHENIRSLREVLPRL
jgi:putative hydrolase of the HAD superfamily